MTVQLVDPHPRHHMLSGLLWILYRLHISSSPVVLLGELYMRHLLRKDPQTLDVKRLGKISQCLTKQLPAVCWNCLTRTVAGVWSLSKCRHISLYSGLLVHPKPLTSEKECKDTCIWTDCECHTTHHSCSIHRVSMQKLIIPLTLGVLTVSITHK